MPDQRDRRAELHAVGCRHPANYQAPLTVTYTGTAPTVQWYPGLPGDTSSPISGQTSATLQTGYLNATTRYWARVSNSLNSVGSQVGTVLVATNLAFADTALSAAVGQPFGKTFVLTATDNIGTPILVEVRDTQPVSGATSDHRFLRLRVTTP